MQDEWHSERWIIEEVMDKKTGVYKIRSQDGETEREDNRSNLRAAPQLQPFGVQTNPSDNLPIADTSPPVVDTSPRRLRSHAKEDQDKG